MCPRDFATATSLGTIRGNSLYECQENDIDAVGTRTLFMILGLESQTMCAEFRVANVQSPVLSVGTLIMQSLQWKLGNTFFGWLSLPPRRLMERNVQTRDSSPEWPVKKHWTRCLQKLRKLSPLFRQRGLLMASQRTRNQSPTTSTTVRDLPVRMWH